MEFLNYGVDLTLKDGSKTTGTIVSVDASHITLNNSDLPISNGKIADLKVTKLPPDLIKSIRKKKDKKQKREISAEPSVELSEEGLAPPPPEEFDFQANLAMFDKKTVFEDFHKRDKVQHKDRLVGHNKVQRKEDIKFKNDEMVLDRSRTDNWDSIGNLDQNPRNMSVTGRTTPSHDILAKTYSFTNSHTSISIPTCSPIQLSDLERITSDSLGISASIMNEVFATNLSNFIATSILGGSSRLNSNNHNLPPLVLLLLGSERCSSRAFTVGRHLSNHGVRVLAYCIDPTTEDEEFTRQKKLFETCGGKIVSTNLQKLIKLLGDLDTPVELIIDALQGYDDHLEDIFPEQHISNLLSLIEWCNTQQQKVMSLDIPSGIDGGSGTISDLGSYINCKWNASMGLPIVGILHGYKQGLLDQEEIKHVLVDIGVPNEVYHRKSSLKRFDKVWNVADNVVNMKLVES